LRATARSKDITMTDTVWVAAVTLFVFGYLLYALLVPEKF
jgi:K+-transporting ATPase KdpF subunit